MTVQRAVWLLSLMVACPSPATVLADPNLDYQGRGHYYEGVKANPVAGEDVHLISVLADYREDMPPVPPYPDRLRLRFYLPEKTDVAITVRELDFDTFYWLDRVQPQRDWMRGYDNEFSWATTPVIRQLEVDPHDLGVLVRLGYKAPRSVEHVAPAILYHSQPPERVGAYVFTLKVGSDARVTCSILREGKTERLLRKVLPRVHGGRPFTVRWDASSAEPGAYKLVITGYLLDTSKRLNQDVQFYHHPQVR